MRLRRTMLVAALAVTAAATSACGSNEPLVGVVEDAPEFEAGTTMAELAEAETVRIGTKFDQPLFGFRGPSGKPEGFDAEIGKMIAGKLGIEPENIEWVETVSANRESFIEEGRVDFVVATYTINDERKQRVDFAGPYFIAGQMLLVFQDETDVNDPDDLAGKTVCSVKGSTPAENIATNYPDAALSLTDAYGNCLDPLRDGQVDAVTTDNVILSGFVDQYPGEFELVGEPFTEEPYGIGLQKGDDEFRSFINDVLEESYDNGTWQHLWEQTAGVVLDTPDPPKVDRY